MSGKCTESDDDVGQVSFADATWDTTEADAAKAYAKGMKDSGGIGMCSADPSFNQSAYEEGYAPAKPSGYHDAGLGPMPSYDTDPHQGPTIGVDPGGLTPKQALQQQYDEDPRGANLKDQDPIYNRLKGKAQTDDPGGPDDVVEPKTGLPGFSLGTAADSLRSVFTGLFD